MLSSMFLSWRVLAADGVLPQALTEPLHRAGIPSSAISVFVQEVDSAKASIQFRAAQPRSPASVIKLLTTYAALEILGPAYTWATAAYATAPLVGAHLAGDLILKGYGDPFLVTERLWTLIQGLRARGLKHIGGDLVIDNTHFATTPENRAAFDGQPDRAYNAHPDALLVNFQAVQFTLAPNPPSASIQVIVQPWPSNLRVKNKLHLATGTCRDPLSRLQIVISPDKNGSTALFGGDYPARCGEVTINRVVMPTTAFAYGVFKRLWLDSGGVLDGRFRVSSTPAQARRIYAIESHPLAELIRGINKYSNNVMTRQLLLTLGAERLGAPGSKEKGITAIKQWLNSEGLKFPELVLDEGAGLSRKTRIGAQSLGRLLLRAYRSPYMPEFLSSLPIAGIDGTLRDRLNKEPITGRAHLKTGQIDGVASIAGYVQTRKGQTLATVCLINHPGSHLGGGKKVHDALLRWLYEHG
ncbi:MAG: D-alanyl-D-alanine carboxypeptidase/D-alanyl-D-alanine endopeptidase [Gammaproteobacteria bacterium]